MITSGLDPAFVEEDDSIDDYKDVCLPNPLSPFCEQDVIPLVKKAFQAAGYRITRAEYGPYHPVYFFRLTCVTAPRIKGLRELQDHLWRILADVGIRLPKKDRLGSRSGDRVTVSFLWVTERR